VTRLTPSLITYRLLSIYIRSVCLASVRRVLINHEKFSLVAYRFVKHL
jgi:hypothetical protein